MSFASAEYSADGGRIFYNHGDASGCCQLWVVNDDGTDAHEFLPRGGAWDGEPVRSPDGRFIAYWHNGNGLSSHGVSVVRADGTGTDVDTGPTLPGTAHWIWSPDSSKILMFPDDSETGTAYIFSIQRVVHGSAPRGHRLVTWTGSASRPDPLRRPTAPPDTKRKNPGWSGPGFKVYAAWLRGEDSNL